MADFKKMVLVDYNDEQHHQGSVNSENIFNIRSKLHHPQSDEIQFIDESIENLKIDLEKILKNSKLDSEDKLLYISSLLRKYRNLKAQRKATIERDDVDLIEKIKSIQNRDKKSKLSPTMATLKERIGEISSILKNTPQRVVSYPPPRDVNGANVGDVDSEDELIIPRTLFDTSSDDGDGVEGSDVDMETPTKHRASIKRRYVTPFPSVKRKKLRVVSGRKPSMIKSWELRPTIARQLKREIALQKVQQKRKLNQN